MSKIKIQLTYAAILLILLAGSVWHLKAKDNDKILELNHLNAKFDSEASFLTLRQFNKEGQLVNILTSPSMHHMTQNDAHLFEKPHIIIKKEDNSLWEIDASLAKAIKKGKQIIFKDRVIIHQIKNDVNQGTFTTDKLTYYPEKKLALTTHKINIIQAGNTIESEGMKAYLNEKRIILLKRAHATYVTKKG